MSESRQTHVTLHDIDPQALEQLVQYAYTAEIVVGEGNVQVGQRISDLSRRCIDHKLIQKTYGGIPPEIAHFLDVAPSSQLAAAQRGAGRLL